MRTLLSLCLLPAFIASAACWAGQPYDSIKTVPYQPYFLPNAYLVGNLLNARAGTTFVDAGSEHGGAARYIAQNTDSSVSVYSVCSWSMKGSYQQFLSDVLAEGNQDRITSLRFSKDEAPEALGISADIIYLNTSDSYTIENDIFQWFPRLTLQGAICGDNWNNNDVALAVMTAVNDLELSLDISGSFWSIHRP